MIATQDASKNSAASAGMLLQFWWLSLGSFASSLPIKVFFCKCQVREQVPPSSHTSPHLFVSLSAVLFPPKPSLLRGIRIGILRHSIGDQSAHHFIIHKRLVYD
jgi:hypothetical protein